MHPYTETTPIVSVGAMDNVPRVRENPFQGVVYDPHRKPIEALVSAFEPQQ